MDLKVFKVTTALRPAIQDCLFLIFDWPAGFYVPFLSTSNIFILSSISERRMQVEASCC